MLVLLNPAAGGGRARSTWRRVSADLERRLGRFEVVAPGGAAGIRAAIARALGGGERRFVAAGGDGTVNLLVGTLASLATPDRLREITVGALGLGSSNDFHKPFRNGAAHGAVPWRLDFGEAAAHDIGWLLYRDPLGNVHRRYWINNASIGVTADGNYRFNTPDAVLRWLKRVATGPAIAYAALRALAAHRPRPLTLRSDHSPPCTVTVSNLGVVKNPHFAGSLAYDSPPEPASGRFYVHLLEGQPRWRLTGALIDLNRGRFMGRPRSRSWRAAHLEVEADEPFAIELDGEVVLARRASFGLLPHHLRICP